MLPAPANGKLMAISVGVCVAAFCLLIFIRDPLLALWCATEKGRNGVCVAKHT